jgi:hypothetical protein
MHLPFSDRPGRHERHFQRRLDNPLFDSSTIPDENELLETQRLDHEELLAFITELSQLVQQAVQLKPNEDSDVVLELKQHLDRLYETSAGLADDQTANQQAIRDLLTVIMHTVRQTAAGDTVAEQKLVMEEQARAAHFHLLKQPLVADLLHPETLIEHNQLAATLLSESPDAAKSAFGLFETAQQTQLLDEMHALLRSRDPERQRSQSWKVINHLSEGMPVS